MRFTSNKYICTAYTFALLALAACSGGSATMSDQTAASDSIATPADTHAETLASLFGPIPSIYENEMKIITREALQQQTDGNADAVRGIMANKADSAYAEAEKKAIPEAVKMMEARINYSVEEGLDYEIDSIKVLCAFLPQLKSTGGEERVALQVNVRTGGSVDAYYILRGKEGAIAYGRMKWPEADTLVNATCMLPAPNVPAAYQEACSELFFVSKETYEAQKSKIKTMQQRWREAYAKEQGLEFEN